VSRSAKQHYRNRVDASVSGGERETPAADDQHKRSPHAGEHLHRRVDAEGPLDYRRAHLLSHADAYLAPTERATC